MRNLGAPLTTIRTGDDAVASFTFLMGAFSPVSSPTEGPFGVGYMVAAIDILEDEGDEAYAEAERAQAETAQAAPQDIVAAAGPKPPARAAGPRCGRGVRAGAPRPRTAIARSKPLIEFHEPVSLWRFEVRRLT